MAGYDSIHLSPLDKPRKLTNVKALTLFSAYMVAYIGTAIYAFINGDTTEFKSDSTIQNYIIKITNEIINSKWLILGSFAFSILSTAVSLFLIKSLSKIIILIALVFECLAAVGAVLVLIKSLLQFEAGSFLYQLIQTAFSCWFLYVTFYMVSRIGTLFMSKIIREACRAVFQFPLAVMLSILFTVLVFMIEALGFSVYVNLSSIDHTKSSLFLLALLHSLNVYGTIWLTVMIVLFWQMVLYGTFGTWFWTRNKSTISSDTAFKNFVTIFRYHMGTVAYGSSPCVIIIVIFIMIKNLSNRMYESRHNIFVMIVCWWYLLTRLFEVSIGVTAIHGQSFKKSADTVCQLYLRFPLRFFSVTKAFTWCAGVLSTVSSLVVIIACVVAFYSENMSNEKMIVALLTTLICIILVVLPIVIVLNAAVTSTFFCILEDFKLDQEDKNRTCFMKASIKDLMLNSE